MLLFRSNAILFACISLAAVASWSQADEKKENEKKEHATARAVLGKAKIDLQTAIKTAQSKVPDGKPMKASVEEEKGKQIFEIHFLLGDKVKSVEVDAVSGAISEVKDDDDEDAGEIAEAKKVLGVSKTSFTQAIAAAMERVKDGKPFEIELESEKGKSTIEVEMLSGNKVMHVGIDAVTGKVTEVEEEKD